MGRVMSAFCSFPHFRISICDSLRLAVEEHAQASEKGWGEADWTKRGWERGKGVRRGRLRALRMRDKLQGNWHLAAKQKQRQQNKAK